MPAPSVITSFPVGQPGGQIPGVHVRDITNGWDLYTLNADTVNNYPASTTKLMTALLIQEYKGSVLGTETVTLSSADVTDPIGGLSTAGLQAGDVCFWNDLLYALFLPSSFEACQCAARIIGDLIYANAGNTGDQGMTRFVEQMNIRAGQLGMTNATYFDPFGGSQTGATIRNQNSPRDLSIVCTQVFTHSNLRAIAITPTHNSTITGANARTLTLTGYNRFTNGPTFNQQGASDPSMLGGKNGSWSDSGTGHTAFSYSGIWKAPGGQEVVITTMDSQTLYSMMLDQRGMMYMLLRDFPYLAPGTVYDASFADVQLLIGADGSIVDESAAARTVTANSVTVGSAVIESSGGMLFNSGTDYVSVPTDSSLNVGSADMTVETWFSGNGTVPGGGVEFIYFSKANGDGSQKEWVINEFSGAIQTFASSDGSNWTHTTDLQFTSQDQATWHNGAPRHLALIKSGSTWQGYICGEIGANAFSMSSAAAGTAPVALGNAYAGSSGCSGNFDDFRVTIGLARYSGFMFTPVSQKFGRSVSPPPPPPSVGQKHKYKSAYNIGGAYA